MTLPLLRLELRKNFLSAVSAVAAFLVTLPMCRLVTASTGLTLALSIEAALTAWVLLGVPLAAALIGASCGAAAAARETVEAEALLPLSPARRAGASLAAAVLLATGFAAFVLATAALLDMAPAHILSPGQKVWGRSFWYDLELAPLLALAALDVLAGAWALARLTGHGVAGGLLALMTTTATAVAVSACFGLEIVYDSWSVSCSTAALLIAACGTAAKAWAAAVAARWDERRAGSRSLAAALALLWLPAVLVWGRTALEFRRLSVGLKTGYNSAAIYSYQSVDDRFPRGRKVLAAAGENAVLETVRGGVVLAGFGGVRTLIREENSGLWDLILEPYKTYVRGVWWDEDGRLWVARYVSPNTELWRAQEGKADSIRTPENYNGSFSMRGGTPIKYRFPDSKRMLIARVDDYFRRGIRTSWVEDSSFLERRAGETAAALPACGGRCLKAGGRVWELPGRALSRGWVYPDQIGGRRAYLVPVETSSGRKVALCRANGQTEIAWPLLASSRGRPTYAGLPDGTLFSYGPQSTLWAIGPDGRVAPPVSFERLRRELPRNKTPFPDLMRRADGKIWLVWGDRLSVLDAEGRTTLTRNLPKGVYDARPLKDGFLLVTKRATYLADWSGATRRIEKPRP